jgi:hypothetical protein
MNTGRQDRRCAVVAREVATRLAAAWYVLRHGLPQVPARETTQVSRDEALETLGWAFYYVGLEATWPTMATSDEIESLQRAVGFVADVRDTDWACIEAGVWPR